MTTSMPPPGYEPAPEGWGARRPSPGQQGDPLTRALLRVVFGLAVLLILLVAIAWHYDGGEADLNPIAEAAQRTASMPGARIAMTATYATSGRSLTFRAEGGGEINWRTGRGRMKLTVPLPGHEFSVEAINDTRTIYMRTSLPDQSLPPGKEWVAVEPYLGHDPGTDVVGSADAQQTLRSLEACGGDVEELGEETIRGVATTHYRGTIERDKLESKLRGEGKADVAELVDRAYRGGGSSFPVEVWIDEDGLVRRVRQEMPVAGEDGATDLTMDMRVELYDFGAEPDIDLPPQDRVFDATPLVKKELGVRDTGANDPSRPPDQKTASADRFLAQVNGVCEGVLDEAQQAVHDGAALQRGWSTAIRRDGLGSAAAMRWARRAANGFYEPTARILSRGLNRLTQISPPSGLRTEYHRYLHVSALQVEALRGLSHAVEVSDYKDIDRLSDRTDALGKQAKALGKKVGITECDR
jgi:hypothetical protein